MSAPIWLLPQGVSETLPQEAAKLESLRRGILDDLQSRGFDLVLPPMIEFLDNLIQGAGSELTTQTFKVPDYDSHKTLGIRADMTPQIAQIDAHRLGGTIHLNNSNTDDSSSVSINANSIINRLCYIGTVLRTKPMTLGGSRELLQIGAEIFGDKSIDADKAIVDAMLKVHQLSIDEKNADKVTLSLSHVGIFSAFIDALNISASLSAKIYDALLRKSTPDILALDASSDYNLTAFVSLSKARGNGSVLDEFQSNAAVNELVDNNPSIEKRIDLAVQELRQLAKHVEQNSQVNLHIDLSELHGYRYHTGLTFQTFLEGEGRAIAKGGRYHGFSGSNDTPRAATGFSADLKLLASKS